MVDPVCVHCCDLGHVSLVSHSCSPAGYPHATEGLFLGPFHLCSLLTAVVWFVLRVMLWHYVWRSDCFSLVSCSVSLIRGTVQFRLIFQISCGNIWWQGPSARFSFALCFCGPWCRNLPLDRHIGICAQALRSFFVAFFSFPTIFLKASSRGHSIWTYTVRELTVNHRGHEDLMWKTLLMWKGNITGASQ